MKAVVIADRKRLSVINYEQPQPDGKKVLIKISLAGICGTDLHLWKAGEPKGLIMGHEFCGVVVDCGERTDLQIGDRVTALPMDPCDRCPACKSGLFNLCDMGLVNVPGVGVPGAYTEYFSSRPDMVRKIPDNVTDREAVMLEPAAVALRAVRRAAVKPGDKVLVTGGGIIGVLCAMWAKLSGATYVALTEINKSRAEKALMHGCVDQIFEANDPELVPKMLESSRGGFDAALECTAMGPAVNTCAITLKTQSKLVLVGANFSGEVPINTLLFLLKELDVYASLGYNKEFDLCLDLLAQKAVDVERFIDDTVGLDQAQHAFERLTAIDSSEIKILFKP